MFCEPEPLKIFKEQDSNISCENIPEESEEKEHEEELVEGGRINSQMAMNV